jgi:hypothetical protein
MFHARRQVCEVILAQRLDLIPVVQNASAFDDEIDLLLVVVENGLAITVRIQSDFPEAGYALEESILFVTLSENRSVAASFRGEIALRLS